MSSKDQNNFDRRRVMQQGLLLGGMALLAGCRHAQPGNTAQIQWPDQDAPTPVPGPSWSPSPQGPSTPTTPGGYYALPSNVIPRGQWTDQGLIKSRLTSNGQDGKMGKILRITVHHDALDSSNINTRGEAMRRLQTVRQGHITRKPEPFADIGYHFVIDPMGNVWEARSLYYQGAHVKGQNENNMGIMMMGNFEYQRPTPAALRTLDSFVAQQMRRYDVAISRVRTHQELARTECPGKNLQRYMLATRGRGGNLARYA